MGCSCSRDDEKDTRRRSQKEACLDTATRSAAAPATEGDADGPSAMDEEILINVAPNPLSLPSSTDTGSALPPPPPRTKSGDETAPSDEMVASTSCNPSKEMYSSSGSEGAKGLSYLGQSTKQNLAPSQKNHSSDGPRHLQPVTLRRLFPPQLSVSKLRIVQFWMNQSNMLNPSKGDLSISLQDPAERAKLPKPETPSYKDYLGEEDDEDTGNVHRDTPLGTGTFPSTPAKLDLLLLQRHQFHHYDEDVGGGSFLRTPLGSATDTTGRSSSRARSLSLAGHGPVGYELLLQNETPRHHREYTPYSRSTRSEGGTPLPRFVSSDYMGRPVAVLQEDREKYGMSAAAVAANDGCVDGCYDPYGASSLVVHVAAGDGTVSRISP